MALSASLRGFEGLEDAHSVSSQVSTRVFSYTTEGTWLTRVYSELVFQFRSRPEPRTGRSERRSSWIGRRADQLPSREEMLQEVQRMAELLLERTQAPLLGDYIGPLLLESLRHSNSSASDAGDSWDTAAGVGVRYWVIEMLSGPGRLGLVGGSCPLAGRWCDDATQTPRARTAGTTRAWPRLAWTWSWGSPRARVANPARFESRVPDMGARRAPIAGSDAGGCVCGASSRTVETATREKALRAASAVGRDSVLVISRISPCSGAADRSLLCGDGPQRGSVGHRAYLLHRDGRKEVVRIGSFWGWIEERFETSWPRGSLLLFEECSTRRPRQLLLPRSLVGFRAAGRCPRCWSRVRARGSQRRRGSAPGSSPLVPESATLALLRRHRTLASRPSKRSTTPSAQVTSASNRQCSPRPA